MTGGKASVTQPKGTAAPEVNFRKSGLQSTNLHFPSQGAHADRLLLPWGGIICRGAADCRVASSSWITKPEFVISLISKTKRLTGKLRGQRGHLGLSV